MPTQYRYIPQHKDGHYLDRVAQPTEDYMHAMRFSRQDDLEHWLTTRHCPDAPHRFVIRRVRVDYELEAEVLEHLPEAN
ncbi:hypothetical protein ABIE27_000341 [Paenibacillus sp. 4624]|uniref:Uncharacterized protein n=2 Tax=Paenibacillus TaxID=44249 RepID=A0ABQ1Z3X8_9BACL|nr:hypothetical protein [Paenibacillus cucumis (ex Kampfer et al. 2016)]MBY0205296.1 hypothetical protein [Paenibacillus cucumis (ex Kampfer et al. 2016)]GGH46195.1 hypothetical protein GCM10008014_08700 [Paenibacillus silvae]